MPDGGAGASGENLREVVEAGCLTDVVDGTCGSGCVRSGGCWCLASTLLGSRPVCLNSSGLAGWARRRGAPGGRQVKVLEPLRSCWPGQSGAVYWWEALVRTSPVSLAGPDGRLHRRACVGGAPVLLTFASPSPAQNGFSLACGQVGPSPGAPASCLPIRFPG